jgi:hypothetical protein
MQLRFFELFSVSSNGIYVWQVVLSLRCTENYKLCNRPIKKSDFEVLTAASMKIAVFWVVAPCSLVEVYQRFRGPCCLHHQDDDTKSVFITAWRSRRNRNIWKSETLKVWWASQTDESLLLNKVRYKHKEFVFSLYLNVCMRELRNVTNFTVQKYVWKFGKVISLTHSIVTDYGLDDWGSIPDRGRGFFF